MNEYELMTILHARLTADETAAAVQSIEAQIAAHGGEMLSTDVWGRRRLAYPIGGSMDGTYVLMTLRMPPEGASPLESWLTVTESVIRHLLIRGIIPYAVHDRDRDRESERERDAEPSDAEPSDVEPSDAGEADAERVEAREPVAVASDEASVDDEADAADTAAE